MKEPSLFRLRKNCANPARKLKLVCSFNGAFHPRPPSGKLRYIGGETRIISVDRNIGFLKLREKIADFCPKILPFWLKYQLAVADLDLILGLVLIESDEDVKCMVEEYENLELYCKGARLWVFVCRSELEYGEFHKGQVNNKVKKNVGSGGNGLRHGDDSLRNIVLKQQLSAKQTSTISGSRSVSGCSFNEGGMEFGSCGKNQKFDHPLIDLGTEEPRGFVSEENKSGGNLLDCETNMGPQMCPLKPIDGNLSVQYNCSMQFPPGQPGGVLCNGLGQPNNSGMISMCNHGLEVPYQTPLDNCHAAAICCEPIDCDLQNRQPAADSQDIITNSDLSKDIGNSNGTKFVRNDQLLDAEECKDLERNYKDGDGTHNLHGGIASSIEFLYNLSLSSSKGVQPLALSSHSKKNVADALIMPQSNLLDLMDELHVDTCPQVDQSSGNTSNPSPTNTDGLKNDYIQEETIQHVLPSDISIDEKSEAKDGNKCSKMTGRISSDLTTFYTHLANRELQTIKSSDLEYIKELGAGAYGIVFHGNWKGSDVAIKKLNPNCFSEVSVKEERLVGDFWREAHILGQLRHPNIVALYGVVADGPLSNLAMVAEYMVTGSLKQVLRRKDRTIDRRKRLIIARDAAFGMEYLHEKNIVHFDLKSHNLLVNMRDPQRPVCKVGDLGLSKIKQRTLISGGVRGTIPWMAPELLNTKNNLVTEKVDVYSFGIVMWELLTGEEPYTDLHSKEIIAGIIKGTLRPEIPSWCDPAWRSLMERCWSTDPDTRPAFSEIAKELITMSAAMNIK